MPSRRTSLSPHHGMLLLVLFWGGNFTAAKIAMRDLDPLAFTAVRFVIGSIVLWAVVRAVEGRVSLPPRALWPLIVLGVIGNTIYQICFIEGLLRTSATKSSLILAGMPAVVTLTAWPLGIERVTRAQKTAILIATAGVIIVTLARDTSIDGGFGLGEILLLAAVITWALYTLLLRHWSLGMSSLNLTAWTMYTGTPGLVLAAVPALMKTHWSHVSFSAWAALAYSALLSLVAAYVLWNRGVALLGAARTVVYNTMVPLVATVIAMIGLGERPGLIDIAGGILIVGGVLITAKGEIRR